MTDLSWRYARASDIDRFYGRRPGTTLNAVVVAMDAAPVCVIGVSCEGDTGLFFSDEKPEFEAHRGRIPTLRALKAAMRLVEDYPLPVYARSETIEGKRLLDRLGFQEVASDIYRWNA